MSKQRGDTIVEVIVAFAIFSMIAVAGLSLMNQGTATAQRTLEITLVRQNIDIQADALRMINREVVSGRSVELEDIFTTWQDIKSRAIPANVLEAFSDVTSSEDCLFPEANSGQKPFIVNPDTLEIDDDAITSPITFARIYNIVNEASGRDNLSYDPAGIWVSAVRGDDDSYHDFHIRACWISPGQSTPMTLGTIVRLYEPQT